jgi:serine/threonine protein kinase
MREAGDYEELRFAGRGRTRRSLMRERSSGREVFVMVMDLCHWTEYISEWSARRLALLRAAIPLIVNLPWFLPTLGFFRESETVGIAVEYCANGTLADALGRIRKGERPVGFGPTELMKCIFGIAFAMAAFHSRKGIHLALSPEAILLDSHFEPVIGRLGLAVIGEDVIKPLRMDDYVGLLYVAPELLEDDEYEDFSPAVDVYAFATLLYEVFGRRALETHDRRPRNQAQIMRRVVQGERCQRLPEIPDTFWDLITACWDQDLHQRPTFSEIVDALKSSPALILPGTDLAAYRKYQSRLEGTRLEDPRPLDLVDEMGKLLGWDSS